MSKNHTRQVNFHPNSRNALPDRVIFTIDIRAVEQAKFERICKLVETETFKIAQAHGVECSIERIGHYEPIEFDKKVTATIRHAVQTLGYDYMDITSGAGHDATWIAGVYPTSMIFCPCVGGISHHESESISQKWADAGANVLLYSALKLANE